MPTRPPTHGQLRRKACPSLYSRRSASARGYGRDWQRLRAIHLAANPLCVECLAKGKVVAGEEVDHIRPHRGDNRLRMDPENLQTLCKPHHSRKTATEDGGFGR